MDDYCKHHEDMTYCERVKSNVSDGYCKIFCKGHPEKFLSTSIYEIRDLMRKPMTNAQKNNVDLVSVLIPVYKDDEPYVEKTIQSLKKNAIGPVEYLVEHDKQEEGHRVLTNRMAKQAKGKYLLRIDAHCAISPQWDMRMKASCKDHRIVTTIIDSLDPDTWEGKKRDTGLVILDQRMRNMYPIAWKHPTLRKTEEETLSMVGCCYMLTKQYYEDSGGCDESLGKWGASGLEWSLKTWLTGGDMIIRTDVVCAHYFRDDTTPFGIDVERYEDAYLRIGRMWRDYRGPGQVRPLSFLAEKFAKYLKRNVRVQRPVEKREGVAPM